MNPKLCLIYINLFLGMNQNYGGYVGQQPGMRPYMQVSIYIFNISESKCPNVITMLGHVKVVSMFRINKIL